jgi:hypothetical protein
VFLYAEGGVCGLDEVIMDLGLAFQQTRYLAIDCDWMDHEKTFTDLRRYFNRLRRLIFVARSSQPMKISKGQKISLREVHTGPDLREIKTKYNHPPSSLQCSEPCSRIELAETYQMDCGHTRQWDILLPGQSQGLGDEVYWEEIFGHSWRQDTPYNRTARNIDSQSK